MDLMKPLSALGAIAAAEIDRITEEARCSATASVAYVTADVRAAHAVPSTVRADALRARVTCALSVSTNRIQEPLAQIDVDLGRHGRHQVHRYDGASDAPMMAPGEYAIVVEIHRMDRLAAPNPAATARLCAACEALGGRQCTCKDAEVLEPVPEDGEMRRLADEIADLLASDSTSIEIARVVYRLGARVPR